MSLYRHRRARIPSQIRKLISAFVPALLVIIVAVFKASSDGSPEDGIVLEFSKVAGAGCPYTASWLVATNLYIKAHWWTEITKMEAASFNIFDKAKLKFQLADPDAYYVHHMSMYEHFVHRKEGFDEAQRRTLILSKAALAGECGNLTVNDSTEFVSLIPFYGGRPPNVTADLKVNSLGQGNSLVNASVKVLQCMATLCSCLKYYGRAVITTTRLEDLHIVQETLQKMPPIVRQRTELVSFQLPKPAFLPFHTLAWGQFYVQVHNCPPPDASKAERLEYQEHGHISPKILLGKSEKYIESYRICTVNVFKNHHGMPFNATYHQPSSWSANSMTTPSTSSDSSSLSSSRRLVAWLSPLLELKSVSAHAEEKDASTIDTDAATESVSKTNVSSQGSADTNAEESHWKSSESWNRAILSEHHPAFAHLASIPSHNPRRPIKYVYYTECDQVVRYDSMETFRALVAASNESTFFVGRRREKTYNTEPEEYMSNLDIYRQCGSRGYSMRWPKETIVQIDS